MTESRDNYSLFDVLKYWFRKGRKKILTAYEIWYADSPHELVGQMMGRIKEGWEPIGGVMYDGKKYYQATVRYHIIGEDYPNPVIKST
jgi:hypothetical protein